MMMERWSAFFSFASFVHTKNGRPQATSTPSDSESRMLVSSAIIEFDSLNKILTERASYTHGKNLENRGTMSDTRALEEPRPKPIFIQALSGSSILSCTPPTTPKCTYTRFTVFTPVELGTKKIVHRIDHSLAAGRVIMQMNDQENIHLGVEQSLEVLINFKPSYKLLSLRARAKTDWI